MISSSTTELSGPNQEGQFSPLNQSPTAQKGNFQGRNIEPEAIKSPLKSALKKSGEKSPTKGNIPFVSAAENERLNNEREEQINQQREEQVQKQQETTSSFYKEIAADVQKPFSESVKSENHQEDLDPYKDTDLASPALRYKTNADGTINYENPLNVHGDETKRPLPINDKGLQPPKGQIPEESSCVIS
jgi:hypothetical protein